MYEDARDRVYESKVFDLSESADAICALYDRTRRIVVKKVDFLYREASAASGTCAITVGHAVAGTLDDNSLVDYTSEVSIALWATPSAGTLLTTLAASKESGGGRVVPKNCPVIITCAGGSGAAGQVQVIIKYYFLDGSSSQ
jgi:hypothetical protein